MDRFEKEIRKKLSDFEVHPPLEVWDAIEFRLPTNSHPSVFYRFRMVAAGVAVLLISALSYFGSAPLFENDPRITSIEATESRTISNPSSLNIPSETITQTESSAVFPEGLTGNKVNLPVEMITYAGTLQPEKSTLSTPQVLEITGLRASLSEIIKTPELCFGPKDKVTSGQIADYKNNYHSPQILASSISTVSGSGNSPNFFLSAFLAPQQSYRIQTGGLAPPLHPLESELITFNGGVLFGMDLHERMDIQTGVVFNMIGQRVHDIAFFNHPSLMPLYSQGGYLVNNHPQSMSTSMGGIVFTDQSFYFADVSSTRMITLKGSYDESDVTTLNRGGTGLFQQLKYLEAPVIFRYKFINRAVDLYAKTGITTSYLLSGDAYLQGAYQTAPIGKIVGVSRINFSSQLGIGVSYPVTEKLEFNIEPTASIFLRPIGHIRSLTKETYPYSWSVMFSFSYKF